MIASSDTWSPLIISAAAATGATSGCRVPIEGAIVAFDSSHRKI
jgi:hypothetical protein